MRALQCRRGRPSLRARLTACRGPVERLYRQPRGPLGEGPLKGPSEAPLRGPLQTQWDPCRWPEAKVVYFFSRMKIKTESAIR